MGLNREPETNLPVGARGLPGQYVLQAVTRFQEIVESRAHSRTPGAKLPRATDLRPYRFCVQDVVLAIWAMVHRKEKNCVEVDVFLTSEVYEATTRRGGYYDPFAGTTAATLTLLSEAFRVGIPLCVHFTRNVEEGRVPIDIVRLAHEHQVHLPHANKGLINAPEGRQLYLALTGFRPPLRLAIDVLAERGLLSPERAAYIVHHGVWSLPEVEGILMCSTYPDLVLSGDVPPEHRHLYQHVQTHARLALMGGLLDRSLLARDYDQKKSAANDGQGDAADTVGLDVEDDERNLDIRTHAKFHAREYFLNPPAPGTPPDSLRLPNWGKFSVTDLLPEQRLCALLRPRTAASLERYLLSDLDAAVQRRQVEPIPAAVMVVIPFDFNDLTPARQEEFRAAAAERNVLLAICPETTRALDQMASKKMQASRIKKD